MIELLYIQLLIHIFYPTYILSNSKHPKDVLENNDVTRTLSPSFNFDLDTIE